MRLRCTESCWGLFSAVYFANRGEMLADVAAGGCLAGCAPLTSDGDLPLRDHGLAMRTARNSPLRKFVLPVPAPSYGARTFRLLPWTASAHRGASDESASASSDSWLICYGKLASVATWDSAK